MKNWTWSDWALAAGSVILLVIIFIVQMSAYPNT